MSHERPAVSETPQQRYAETVFESLPPVEIGIEIPRASATRLTSGKTTEVKLSVKEKLGREGWDFQELAKVRKGGVLRNYSGELFEVVDVRKGQIKIRNHETGTEGEIVAQSRATKAHEYSYVLRDRAAHSKKVSVYETVYRDASLDTGEFLDAIIQSIPVQCMDVFDEVQIHPKSSDEGGSIRVEPSLFSDKHVLTLYVDKDGYITKQAVETLYHELGHAIVKYLKGTMNPGRAWRHCMVEDAYPISEYAAKKRYPKQNDNGETEDFAESVTLYLATDGAKTEKTKSLRKICGNRFEKLDQVFEDLSRRQNSGTFSKLLKSGSSLDS